MRVSKMFSVLWDLQLDITQRQAAYKGSKKRIGPIGEMQQWNRTFVPTSASAIWESLVFCAAL